MPEKKAKSNVWIFPLPDGSVAEIEGPDGQDKGANRGGKGRLLIKLFIDENKPPVLEKELYELSEGETVFLHPIGPGEGISVEHCVYLGAKYEKQFLQRICGYRTLPPGRPSCKVKVVFYEDTAQRI